MGYENWKELGGMQIVRRGSRSASDPRRVTKFLLDSGAEREPIRKELKMTPFLLEISLEQIQKLHEHHGDIFILIEQICGPRNRMYLVCDGKVVVEFFVKEEAE